MLKQKEQTKVSIESTEVQKDPERCVYLDNKLLKFGVNHLSAPSIKILYLVIARYLNSDISAEHPVEVDIPFVEIRNIVPAITKGQATRIVEELKKPFKIPGGIFIKGQNHQGELTWFTSITEVGEKKDMVRFRFDPLTFEPTIVPNRSTTLYRPEINRLKSGYAIKIFQVLRSIQNRQKDWTIESRRKFDIDQIKDILGIPRFKKLDLQTIQRIIDEINQFTNLRVKEVISHPEKGDPKSLEFVFAVKPFKKTSKGSGPGGASGGGNSEEDSGFSESHKKIELEQTIEPLTWTQQIAFDKLIAFGVKKDIALRQMIPDISKGETIGYEDVFLDELLISFRENSPIYNADTFSYWWTSSTFFQPSGKIWKSSLVKLKAFKERLEIEQPEVFEKRSGKNKTELWLERQTILPDKGDFPTLKPMIS